MSCFLVLVPNDFQEPLALHCLEWIVKPCCLRWIWQAWPAVAVRHVPVAAADRVTYCKAMGANEAVVGSALRIGLSRFSTLNEIERAAELIVKHRLRLRSPATVEKT